MAMAEDGTTTDVPEETKAETSTSAAAAVETELTATGEEDAEMKTKAAAQGLSFAYSIIFPHIDCTIFQVEFYFADANLPYDK